MFDGRVVALLPHGSRAVELANGHRIRALPAPGLAPDPDVGASVSIEWLAKSMLGWRLKRPPLAAGA